MTDKIVQPKSSDELCRVVSEACEADRSLTIEGGGTRGWNGHGADIKISTLGLNGITIYEPQEMVLSAKAGTPLADIKSALAEHNQTLPFEPYGEPDAESTIGGVVAANIAGSRRMSIGHVRDHLIGLNFVNGRGDQIKSGGRVMKNVTGLDLTRIMCGAHGTLGIITDVTFKLIPKAQSSTTLRWTGLTDADAINLMTKARRTPFEILSAAHLPATDNQDTQTLLRLDGFAASISERIKKLSKILGDWAAPEQSATDLGTWNAIAAGNVLSSYKHIWRIALRSSKAADLIRSLPPHGAHQIDCGGASILVGADTDITDELQSLAESLGGHAILVKTDKPDTVRHPHPAPETFKLIRAVKASLDPKGLFNRGRLYAEM